MSHVPKDYKAGVSVDGDIGVGERQEAETQPDLEIVSFNQGGDEVWMLCDPVTNHSTSINPEALVPVEDCQ